MFQAFHDIAYRADSREDLLSAINGFLDDTVVLPPGEWDRNVLLPILISQSRIMARRRKMAKAGKNKDGECFCMNWLSLTERLDDGQKLCEKTTFRPVR